MQFNPTDKSNSIIADIDFLLFGDGGTFNTDYSLIDRTRSVNISMDEAVSELFKADPNFMWDDTTNPDFPVATTALVAARPQYVLPDESLVVHRMRVKNQEGEFVTLTPVSRRELSDSELSATGTPEKYYKIDNALFPVPIPDYGADDGVELEFQRGANHFLITDTTKSPGFNSQFHPFLSVSASLRYASANGMDKKAAQLRADKEVLRNALREHYLTRAPDQRPQLRLRRKSIRGYAL